jgi:hypothetical protein
MKTFLKLCRIIPCRNESAMRQRWQKYTAGQFQRQKGSHAAATDMPVCWSWTSIVYTYTVDHMYIEFLLVPELKELLHKSGIIYTNSIFKLETQQISGTLKLT